jgi:predicted ATP-dependent endonuclease of OLD family
LVLNDDQKIKLDSQVAERFEFKYLIHFDFYKKIIDIYNMQNINTEAIERLFNPFVMLSGYRNYNNFTRDIALSGNSPNQQIETLEQQEKQKSFNSVMAQEPEIFGITRIRLAKKHLDLALDPLTPEQRINMANNQDFIKKINKNLEIINLELKIKLKDILTWKYQFEILDTIKNTIVTDINHLSAGQKSILHLILETYGRWSLNGGVIIIDEPELHLHYQFQYEFLKIIEDIANELKTQYIIVTHSECLINSQTIKSVTRFGLESGSAKIYSPDIQTEDRWLVHILDNSRSISSFFCNKILLVEGQDDRYFFREAINFIYPELRQDIYVIDITGKGKFDEWERFFINFGLKVYKIADLDYYATKFCKEYSSVPKDKDGNKLYDEFKIQHPDLNNKIEEKYQENLFILKNGALEVYLDIHNKGLSSVILFCKNKMINFKTITNDKYDELKDILKQILIGKL